MFELDKAIDGWCRSVVKHRCTGAARLDELKDHLHSAVEYYQQQGLAAEQAFHKATQQLGDANELWREYAKNRDWKALFCAEEMPEAEMDPAVHKKLAKQMVVHSIAWAAAFIGSALLISDTRQYQLVFGLLFVLWFVSSGGLQSASGISSRAQACAEWRWFKSLGRRLVS